MRTRVKQKGLLADTDLMRLVRRFEAWRRGKRSGERIPADLWKAAAAAARIHGMNRTCRALRLSFYDLKRRQFPDDLQQRTQSSSPTFLELPMPAFKPDPLSLEHAVLELTHPGGSKLSLRSAGVRVGDFLPVIEAFLGS